MIKKIFAALGLALAFCLSASGQSLTTITGTMRDQTGALITSGQVVFTLQPGIDTMTSGIARFSPTEVDCTINGSGLVKALDGVSACTLVQNTSIQPSGTSYRACLQPGFISPGSCFVFYALTSSLDITTTPATPPLTPAYSLVDIFSNQTIAGTKTFSGSVIFGGSLTLGAVTLGGTLNLGGNAITNASAGTFSGNLTVSGDYLNTALATVKWGSSGTSSPDVGLSRCGVNTLCLGNGTQGSAAGILNLSGLGIGGSSGAANTINAATGTVVQGSGSTIATIKNTGIQFNAQVDFNGQTIKNTGTLTLPTSTGTLAELGDFASPPAIGNTTPGTGKFTTLTATADTQVKRIKANQGTALVNGDFGTLTGFGTTASIASVAGTDAAGLVNVSSSGTGQAANATVVLTFHDGTWTTGPLCIIVRGDASSPAGTYLSGVTATALTIGITGTPSAGITYQFVFICIGR